MLIAINPHIINKSIEDVKKHNHSFENVDISIEQLSQHIKNGSAFCAQYKKKRLTANFTIAGFLAVDIDNGLTLEQAQADTFFQNYASLLYTTSSHTPENHKFRIVFELEKPITDGDDMRYAYKGLIARFGGDASCKDACRMFFGSSSSTPIVLGKCLPAKEVDELIIRGQESKFKSASKIVGYEKSAIRSGVTLDISTMVKTARGDLALLSELDERTPVYCPKHIDRRPSAFTLRNKRGTPGVHCSACNATFFLDDGRGNKATNTFDFDYNWLKPTKISNEEYMDNMDDACNIDLIELRGISKFATRYMPFDESLDYTERTAMSPDNPILKEFEFPIDGPEGFCPEYDITLIKSPKGTGKTELLINRVKELKKHNISVLLIGHRRTLISATATRLGLTSYLRDADESSKSVSYNQPTPHFAICVDSLATKLDTRVDKYDVILIDEVEQVFAHLLSSTMRDNRRVILHTLQFYLQNAKAIYALDADLNRVTVEILVEMLKNLNRSYIANLNTWEPENGTVNVYQNRQHLIGELHASIERGERCFVCSNSKTAIDGLSLAINRKITNEIKTISITADNAHKPEIQQFIKDIRNRAIDYDVIFASPAMGTGVDITFKNDEQLIDSVFGIFEARINTHFDIDQQLSRVRHPKRINVYVTPETFNFETDVVALKTELHSLEGQHRVFVGIDSEGARFYNEDPLYDTVFSYVTAWQRASKNQLRKHFIDLRKNNGWVVEVIAPDKKLEEIGKKIRKEGKLAKLLSNFEQILQAEIISSDDFNHYKNEDKAGKNDDSTQDMLSRYVIESFYRQDADMELLELDNNGNFRNAINTYELIACKSDEEIQRKDSYSENNYAADRDNLMIQKQLLSSLLTASGLFNQGVFNLDVQIEKSDLANFAKCCLKNKVKIEQLFEVQVRSDVIDKPIQQLNTILKILGLSTIPQQIKQSGGKKYYFYQLDKNKLESVSHWASRRVETSFDDWKELRNAKIIRLRGGTPDKKSGERLTAKDPMDIKD